MGFLKLENGILNAQFNRAQIEWSIKINKHRIGGRREQELTRGGVSEVIL